MRRRPSPRHFGHCAATISDSPDAVLAWMEAKAEADRRSLNQWLVLHMEDHIAEEATKDAPK